MNENIYLDFFYRLVRDKEIIEKRKLNKFLKDKRIEDKYSHKREVSTDIFVCNIELENDKVLLVEDFPINFLISQTILIGDRAKVSRFKIRGDKREYVCKKEVLEKIRDKLEIEDVSDIKAREVANKGFEFSYEQPKIIEHLREYVSSVKSIDFKKTHLVRGEEIELFVPTAKHRHFKLAASMNIPLISIIDNNYIKESVINIYDTKKIAKITKPTLTYREKREQDVLKANNLRIYNDVDEELYIRFDEEEIIEILNNTKKTNFDIGAIIKEIKKFKGEFEISSNHGKYPIPLWKSTKGQKFIEIRSPKDFSDMSGVEFRIENELFANLYLQTLLGEEAKYKNRFLKKKFEDILENLQERESITFRDEYDLIIQIIYNKNNNIKEILVDENINSSQIQEIKNNIKKILKEIILTSVEHSKIPRHKEPGALMERYYQSLAISIRRIYERYLEDLCKKELIKELKKYLVNIKASLKEINPSYDDLYPLSIIVLNSLEVLEEFDKDTAVKIREVFNSYFKDFEVEKINAKEDPRLERFATDSIFAKKLSRTKEIKIIEKIRFDRTILKGLDITSQEPDAKSYTRADKKKLKSIFKYNYEDVSRQISALKPEEINEFSLVKVNGKFLEIKEDFYTVFKRYRGYKQVLENEWFKVLARES